MSRMSEPAVVSHYDVQRVVDIYGSVQGRDLGGVANDVQRIVTDAAKKLPRGSRIVTRGQVATMQSSFTGLFYGLAFAVVVFAEQTVLANERTEAQIAGERMVASVVLIKTLGGGWNGTATP
jgi:multidrug efflux pump subunit AcrB